MKLAVFGCSWSYGTSQHRKPHKKVEPNWVRCLSKIRPDISITSFAHPGTSLQFSAFLFEQFAQEFDYTIFQITGSGRLCFWPDQFNFKKHMIQYEDNLIQFDDLDSYIFSTNISALLDPENNSWIFKNKTADEVNFAHNYFKYMPSDILELEYRAIVDKIYNKANLTFWHHGVEQYRSDIFSINQILGDEQYKQYVMDSGYHFDEDGCKWQANYINDKYLK
tara:strand:- start:173 stop:838 length:666 start_codon:yes stop_codon:yes gene_type:complete